MFVVTLITLSVSVQFSSVTQLCPTLCNPVNCSTPGLPVHHQLPEFILTHVHRVIDAIQPSHPLSSPFPPAPNPSDHKSFPMSQLFTWGSQSTGVSALASFLPKNTQSWKQVPLGDSNPSWPCLIIETAHCAVATLFLAGGGRKGKEWVLLMVMFTLPLLYLPWGSRRRGAGAGVGGVGGEAGGTEALQVDD